MCRLFPATALLCAGILSLSACGTRESISVVGSSTVFPFARIVAENFARTHPEYKSPVIEATGTGGGIALFCDGTGPATPDMANASRRMKLSEFEKCRANGVSDITEIQVGLDGIAFAVANDGIKLALTPQIVYRALAKQPYGREQTNETWADVDPSLPDVPILVYGPPEGSGTRDALVELVLETGCAAEPMAAGVSEDEAESLCKDVRSDGAYVSQGEQDNLTVQKISSNPRSIGIFGFSYLDENAAFVTGIPMNGVAPTYENISNFSYPGARPLYVYVKNAHLGAIPGIRDFIAQWKINWSASGPLAAKGLVANRDEQADKSAMLAETFAPLTKADFN